MYRGSCSCQAIQYEIDQIGELDADDETLTHSDTSQLSVTIEKKQLIVDCAPSALAHLHESSGETHHVCNICGSVIFVERGCNKVSVDVTYSGHDVLAESHRQFVF